MNAFRFALAAGLFSLGAAQAQLLQPAAPAFEAQPSPLAKAFARKPSPFDSAYMVDEGEHPFTRLFDGYRTDPRLLAGFNLNRYLALEAGYLERQDRGFHAINPRSPFDTNGALGAQGFHSHAAAKVSVHLTDDLSAYGKLGVAHSERRGADAVGRGQNTDTGLYTGVGAKYKLTEKASVSVEGQKFGNTEKWGNDSNGNKVNAKLNLGF